MSRSPRLAALAAGLAVACGSHGGGGAPSSAPQPGTSFRASTTLLARGVVATLPAGTLFISVYDLTTPAATTVPSPSTAGILYVVSGAATVSGAAPTQLKATEGASLQPGPAQLANPGTVAAEWYFITVQPAAGRGGLPALAGATRIFATDDLPPLPQLNQAEVLQRTVLQEGGRAESYRPNGVEVFVGLGGTAGVQADTLTGSPTITRGKALFVLEGTPLQVLNRGSGPAAYVSFFLLPDGSPLTRSTA